MAEPITYNNSPVARRGSGLTWLIPAIIIAAILIGYYAYSQHQKNLNPSTTATTQTPAATSTTQKAKNTDLSSAAAGTKATLSSIAINQVVTSRIFTIKSGSQTIYTVLAPGVSLPAKTTLKSGQQVAITGTLLSTNSDQFKALDLTASEKSALANQQLVLLVDSINISTANNSSTSNTSGTNTTQTNTGASAK